MNAPRAWIRRIAPELPKVDEIPLFGKATPLDWNQFSSLLASRFSISGLSLKAKEQAWRETHEVKEGLGTEPLIFPIVASPIGTVFWISSRQDMMKFTSWMLNRKSKAKPLSSDILQEGFYRYLILEALDTLQTMDPFQKVTMHLSEEERIPDEPALCIDVEIGFEERSCWGRLVIPSGFRKRWVQHFDSLPSEYIPNELAKQTQLTIGIKTGSVLLHLSEWKKLKEGDFLLLDRGSYDPRHETGICVMTLGPTPLFNVKIRQNQIELLDYAFYYEENMEQSHPRRSHEEPVENIQPAEGESVAIKELPIFVTVELARLKVTLDQLMHMNPGNLLELPVHPDQHVSLTVNGQQVGKAELVHLGETLGLRIVEVG